jgi:membrane dipeptidase
MSDDMIKRLGDNGGVIQINFGSSFISGEIRKKSDGLYAALGAFMAENNVGEDSPETLAFLEEYRKEHEIGYADVTEVVDHIDHVVNLVGVNHVGLGSDFDGVGDSLPTGLKDVSYYPNLIYHLLKRGYSEADIEKICSGNVLRVWSAVEQAAEAS